MSAYRSPEEATVRSAVVSMIRNQWPDARVMHEINSSMFGNRTDVLAVTESEIFGFEIKSKKDKLDRAIAQRSAMQSSCSHNWLVLHEKFLPKLKEDGLSLIGAMPYLDDVVVFFSESLGIVGCNHQHALEPIERFSRNDWRKKPHDKCLPSGAIHMLWKDELLLIAKALGGKTKDDKQRLVDLILWNLTGEQITRAICKALRTRECIEADATITPPEEE